LWWHDWPQRCEVGQSPQKAVGAMTEQITVSASVGRGWALLHRDSYLGFTRSEDDAILVALSLVQWLAEQGRSGELVFDRTTRERCA
jgi:hypothetical protein